MDFDPERVRENVQKATTEDLLDRVTVYRAGLEPEAVVIILEELKARGVTPEAVVAHEEKRREVIADEGGIARVCAWCDRPAVVREWGWHRLYGKVPVFPRPFYLCEEHRTKTAEDDEPRAAA